MRRKFTLKPAVIAPFLLAATAFAQVAPLDEPRADRNAPTLQKAQKRPDVRAPKKAAAPAKPGSSSDSAVKNLAAQSKRQHDEQQKVIDNLK